MPLPFIGMGLAALARSGAAKVARKIAGKALRAATGGRLLGAGGGAAAVKRVGGAVLGVAAAAPVLRGGYDAARGFAARGSSTMDYGQASGPSYGRRYRRMNPLNVRALRRSVRRVHSAEKLFRKVFTITKGQVNLRKARRSS